MKRPVFLFAVVLAGAGSAVLAYAFPVRFFLLFLGGLVGYAIRQQQEYRAGIADRPDEPEINDFRLGRRINWLQVYRWAWLLLIAVSLMVLIRMKRYERWEGPYFFDRWSHEVCVHRGLRVRCGPPER